MCRDVGRSLLLPHERNRFECVFVVLKWHPSDVPVFLCHFLRLTPGYDVKTSDVKLRTNSFYQTPCVGTAECPTFEADIEIKLLRQFSSLGLAIQCESSFQSQLLTQSHAPKSPFPLSWLDRTPISLSARSILIHQTGFLFLILTCYVLTPVFRSTEEPSS